MKTIDCIKERRSRRLFTDEEVSDDLINIILECGVTAPSSMDCQPWHFVIVRDKDKQKKIADLKSDSNQQHILTAPVTIVVCVDSEKSHSRYIEDGVTATQNMLLAIHDLSLGSVYVTGCKESKPEVAHEIREILNLPEKIIPVTVLPVGYVDNSEQLENKKLLDISKITHRDEW